MQFSFLVPLAVWAALSIPAWGRASGTGLTGMSGAPGEATCTRCHSATSGSGTVTVTADSSTFTAGQQVHLRITVADSTAKRWGYELSARTATATSTTLGTLTTANAYSQISTASSLQYATQTSAGTQTGTMGTASYDLVWTAPAELSGGAVTFYAVGLACDGNGSDAGDKTYTTSVTLQPAATTTVPGTALALPQFVYGGGWATTLYFGNTTTAATAVALKFTDESGAALSVPAAGGTSATLALAARGTAVLAAPDSGTLTSGWVQATLPAGVTGYAVFSQTQADGTLQEAVVPLAGTATTSATLLFDETTLITAAAVLNPSASPANIAITARDETGATLGTATLTLAAGAKQAFALRDVAGLAGLIGKRGSLDFVASSGAVSVLGLRFSSSAFTSIPALER